MSSYKSLFSDSGVVTFTDLDFSLKANPFNGDLRKKTDVEAVKQSFRNILFTKRGEKHFNPTFGGNLYDLLFEPLDDITELQIKQAISSVANTYEKRIVLIDVQLLDSPQTLEISITFSFKTIFKPETIKYIINRSR